FIKEDFYMHNYIAMSIRIDRKKIPPSTLKHYILKEEMKRLKESGKEQLSYREKKQIKEAVYDKLLRRALPVSSVYDFLWNINSGMLLFFWTNGSVNNIFIELFHDTFQMELIKMSPLGIALSKGFKREELMNLKEELF
ncbi:MAG: hypothetical protein D6828_00985, partial [Nitrospirae bacterium]